MYHDVFFYVFFFLIKKTCHRQRIRNGCCVLPFKYCTKNWDRYGSDYISLIRRFNSKKNSKLKMFCILYNCMANIFIAGDGTLAIGGLDKYIFRYQGNCSDLFRLCQWYMLVQMVKSNFFGSDEKYLKRPYHFDKDVYSSEIVTSIISNIFDNDLTAFEKLLK